MAFTRALYALGIAASLVAVLAFVAELMALVP